MDIKQPFTMRSSVFRGHVNKYAILGLGISFLSILIATALVSYQMTGFIDVSGFIYAQKSNPAIWALDLTPIMFAYWGQLFCYELATTMETLIEDKTRELINKSSDLELKLHYETNHDHLTNLPNQRLLIQRIKQGIQQIHKGEQLAVIILHINLFKDINTKYGNFNGNNLLVQFSEKLKTILLEPYMLQEYMGMNMVARMQGAEFAILIPRLRKEHNFDDLLAKLLAATSTILMIDGNSINITTTAGVALYPIHGETDTALLQHASFSLFYAEKEGLSHALYQVGMDKDGKASRVKTKELSDAIDNGNIGLLFQPDLELKTEKIIGAEAVIHFDSVKYGEMTAETLIPLFEGTALVKKLTKLILNNAIQQLALWHKAGHKIYMKVNLFHATDTELPSIIAGMLKENKIAPDYLKLELTEKACLSDQTQTLDVLKEISDLGVKIVISDFCSGYTSFSYLTNFPINEITIDKSFVTGMMSDEKKMSIVRAVINLADTMNLIVFADGIADLQIMKKLKELNCLYGQGPYFSPAVDADGLSSMLGKPSKPKKKSSI